MNERFKFRFFDKVLKEMCYPTEYNGKAEYLERRYDLADMFRFKDLIPMQCTGLKDKNGKLIFEGDIIKYIDCEGKETIGYLAIDRFNLLTFANMVNCDFCEEWADVVKAVFFTGNSTIEVIGNIYENKELLKEKK